MVREDRFDWLDSLRVLASFLVIVSHYSYYFTFERLDFIYRYFAGWTGRIGVSLFFAISGYLISHSISKHKNLLSYYISKIIRIMVPYCSSYIVLSILLIVLSLLREEVIYLTPLSNVFFVGGNYKYFLLGLIPIDVHLMKSFNLSGYWFVGEWFIGTLILLYIISPVLYYLAKKIPILGSILLIIISLFTYRMSGQLINHGFWLFLVRAPELYIGMILHFYRAFINKKLKNILLYSLIFMLCVLIFDILKYNYSFIADRFIPLKPRSFLFTLPLIITFFLGSEWINRTMDLSRINKMSKISYTFMLIQHVVINCLMWHFDESKFSKLGALICFGIIFFVTIYLAIFITKLYKPIEKWLLTKSV